LLHTIVAGQTLRAGKIACSPTAQERSAESRLSLAMSPTWIWMQIAIVVFVLIGMIIAITKLA
jgi:hypothetical protein